MTHDIHGLMPGIKVAAATFAIPKEMPNECLPSSFVHCVQTVHMSSQACSEKWKNVKGCNIYMQIKYNLRGINIQLSGNGCLHS